MLKKVNVLHKLQQSNIASFFFIAISNGHFNILVEKEKVRLKQP